MAGKSTVSGVQGWGASPALRHVYLLPLSRSPFPHLDSGEWGTTGPLFGQDRPARTEEVYPEPHFNLGQGGPEKDQVHLWAVAQLCWESFGG